jgi:tetratricopeptide (TPR) repeat protein
VAGFAVIALVTCLLAGAAPAEEQASTPVGISPSSLAFVQELSRDGDHEGAARECRRLLFFSPTPSDEPLLRFTLAHELYLAQEYPDAITEFRNYYIRFPEDQNTAQAMFLWGNSELLAGNADAADKVWRWVQREHPSSDWAARAGIKLGLAEAGKNNWIAAANNFNWIDERSETYKALGRDLTALAAGGKKMPRRDVTTGVILSTVLPGAGQAYSGRWGDATAALVITGGLGTLAVLSYLDKQYVGAGVLGFLGITFYAGNIYNGGDAALQFNRRQELKLRQEILDRIKQEKLEE